MSKKENRIPINLNVYIYDMNEISDIGVEISNRVDYKIIKKN